jgi:hypothetical protein
MLSEELLRALDADRARAIEEALERRRLLDPPDEAVEDPIRASRPIEVSAGPSARSPRARHEVAVDCCP